MQVALAATMKSYGVQPGRRHRPLDGRGGRGRRRRSAVAGRRGPGHLPPLAADVHASPVPARWHRWNCLPSRCFRSWRPAASTTSWSSVVASPQSTVIGGATQSVRELVAAWEQRDVMAREVAVDVASHSPQVDPILDELTEVLADLNPMTPEVPFYSATLFDPRDEPVCDADYWVDNLRHTVRFAAAVQAALEDGYRVFAELAPHPLLTHAVEQTARSLDMPVAALAGMRREQQLPHGLRGFAGGSAQRGRRGGLLRAVPGWAAGRRTAADLDPPSPVL